ncbi:peptidoglycan recognition family protein [Nocardiopsis sp. YSL2]|uniref:peptidoglycan recognition protein family protein n=1 Tax=Nocardiopsis sp. YSL2 TaxID=2939492 RepID=UPI0026F4574E|nr:peptidoglycan recognition family protein [Nocardiopsis sp. YSL2]
MTHHTTGPRPLDALFEDRGDDGEEGFLSWWPFSSGVTVEDRTDTPYPHSEHKRARPRPADTVYALVLHQMAFRRSPRRGPGRYDKVTAHYIITESGRLAQLHPVTTYLYASNGFNSGSVAVEFSGNLPSVRGRCWSPDTHGCHELTQAQVSAGRGLLRHLVREIGLTHVLAHRQASGSRTNCPGPDIWYNVGQWGVDELGLKDGGPGFHLKGGNPIPDEWRTWGRSPTR